jgi:hypothetical protein
VLGNLLAQVMARGSAGEDQHLEVGGEAMGLPFPVVEDGGGADDQGGFGAFALFAQPGQPGQGLQGFAEAHVVGQNPAQLQAGEMHRKSNPDFW